MASLSSSPVFECGPIVHGVNGKYELRKRLGNGWSVASLFKAQMLDRNGHTNKWCSAIMSHIRKTGVYLYLFYRVIIKTRPADSRVALETEYHEHTNTGISSCKFIRPLLDVIPGVDDSLAQVKDGNIMHGTDARQVPQGLVFRWMEHNLYDFNPEQYQQDYVLPAAVATGVLQALVPFEKNRRIHTDIKPDNILIDCLGPRNYDVKLSDLGESNDDGFSKELIGSLLTRAPEVWEGKGYFHTSDLWALGVVLFERFTQGAFSFPVVRDDVLIDTIMLAKLMRLLPEWNPSPVKSMNIFGQSLEKVFADARRIKDSIPILPLSQQLGQINIPEKWRGFLRLLFTLDRNERPSASELLRSSEYQAILRNEL